VEVGLELASEHNIAYPLVSAEVDGQADRQVPKEISRSRCSTSHLSKCYSA